MKINVRILTALTVFLIESELVNSMEVQETIREKAPEHIQQIELLNNSLQNPVLMKGIKPNSVPSKIIIDELPKAEPEIRFYRKRTGSTTAEIITFKVFDELKDEIENIDKTMVYFNNQIKNSLQEEAQIDTPEEAQVDTNVNKK